MILAEQKVLDHGYVKLLNLSGPVHRGEGQRFDADDTDFAKTARVSYGGKEHTREQDLKLAGYLVKNLHTTPIEMVECWWEVKLPIFVARQFVRHRTVSINEISARYTKLDPDFYIPHPENVGVKSATNKQGRDITKTELDEAVHFCNALRMASEDAYSSYAAAIGGGIPNELARCFLPVNIYTKWIWKQDLWNTMHFLRLRLHSHAQYEARAYAEAMYQVLENHLPHTMGLFDQHVRMED